MTNVNGGAATASQRPYIIKMADRWIILAIILAVSQFFCKPLYGYSIYFAV